MYAKIIAVCRLRMRFDSSDKMFYAGILASRTPGEGTGPVSLFRFPAHSAFTLWNQTGASPTARWGMLFASGSASSKGAASATLSVYRAEYRGLLTFFRSHSKRDKFPLPAGFPRRYFR